MTHWTSLTEHFAEMDDPRVNRTKLHDLMDILVLSFCAVLAGASGWTDIADYARTHQGFFRPLLGLPNGVPGKDTFRRVISRINPEQFLKAFLSWTAALSEATDGQLLAIDGKVLRKALQENHLQALNLVSVWSVENQMLLAQAAVPDGSNEIPAIPEVLQLLNITGAVISIDAIGCQKEIVKAITAQDADFVIALKANQPTLSEACRTCFDRLLETNFEGVTYSYFETDNANEKARHGRDEFRAYYQIDVPEEFAAGDAWSGLKTLGLVIRRRVDKGQESWSSHYYISSLPQDAGLFARSVRGHWGIENQLHWRLDVLFREDECTIAKDHGAENFGCLRRMALNLFQQDQTDTRSIRRKQKQAAWDIDYLVKLLKNCTV